jgi:flagellar biosynthesis protein FlhG
VVNMARDKNEAERVSGGIVEVSHRFLEKPVRALGFVPADEQVAESVRNRKPFVLSHPNAQATKAVSGIGRTMMGESFRNGRSKEGILSRIFGLSGRTTPRVAEAS